jgi:hypothetical protein
MITTGELAKTAYKTLDVYIDGYKLQNSKIQSLDMMLSIDSPYIEGRLLLTDEKDLINTIPIISESKVSIDIQEQDGAIYKYNLSILSIDVLDAQKGEAQILITMMDTLGYEMLSHYPVKGFSNSGVDQILKDDKVLGSLCKEMSIEINSSEVKTKFESYIFPGNKPIINSLGYLKRASNVYIFRSRKSLEITNLKDMFLEEPKQPLTYKTNTENIDYLYRVHDIQITPGDAWKGKYTLADFKVFSYNILNKTNKPFDLTYKDSVSYLQEDTTNLPEYSTSNSKYFYKSFQNYQAEMSHFYDTNSRQMLEVSIIVTGSQKVEPGDTINLESMGNIFGDTYNKTTTGKWLVKRVKDTLTFESYVQELTLIKSTLDEAPEQKVKKD